MSLEQTMVQPRTQALVRLFPPPPPQQHGQRMTWPLWPNIHLVISYVHKFFRGEACNFQWCHLRNNISFTLLEPVTEEWKYEVKVLIRCEISDDKIRKQRYGATMTWSFAYELSDHRQQLTKGKANWQQKLTPLFGESHSFTTLTYRTKNTKL